MYCISGSDLVWQVAAEKKRKDEEAAAREAAEKEQREREETDDRTAAKQRALDLRDSVAYHRQGPLEALLLYSRHPMRHNARGMTRMTMRIGAELPLLLFHCHPMRQPMRQDVLWCSATQKKLLDSMSCSDMTRLHHLKEHAI